MTAALLQRVGLVAAISLLAHSRGAAQSDPELANPPPDPTEQPLAEPATAAPAETGEPTTGGPAAEGAEDDFTMSEAELAQMGLSTEGGETAAEAAWVELHGFVDFGIFFVLFDENWRNSLQPHPSFFVGNFNLYLSKDLTDTVRMFSEVRFLFLPNGTIDREAGSVAYTWTEDYADIGRPTKWSGIEIERVYLEWAMTPWLTLRVGQFLSPYGIWNVDHGSPTVIPVLRPYVIGLGLIPEHQTGLELRGQVSLSASHSVGYHLTLSNGIGPVSEYRDLDDNKAVGARAYWSFEGLGRLTIGASGFIGTDADTQIITTLDADGNIVTSEQVNSSADVLSLGVDLQWSYEGLLIQGEFITRQQAYTDGGRPVIVNPLSRQRMALSDTFDFGSYLLFGYRFDWLGVMPFIVINQMDYVERQVFSRPRVYVFDGGFNIRPIESVVIKVQYQHGYWPDGFLIGGNSHNVVYFQLAWAF